MILVDTSVWVDHFRTGSARLKSLLEDDLVLAHPFIVGELACGSIRNRNEILQLLQALPSAIFVEHSEILAFIEFHRLHGRGLGYIDAHLLASAKLCRVGLWTLDKSLQRAAAHLEIPA